MNKVLRFVGWFGLVCAPLIVWVGFSGGNDLHIMSGLQIALLGALVLSVAGR